MTDIPLLGPVPEPDLHVMSFNIRRRMKVLKRLTVPGPDHWERRRPVMQRLLATEQPTILGSQEALPDQAGFIRHALGERYRSVGHGREANGRGEGCPVFYDRERVELLDWTQTALSDTPDVAGSTSWGNRIPRIIVNAAFRDRATGNEFRVLNTHFDHLSRISRLLSAEEILRLVAESTIPAVATGDFNLDVNSPAHEKLTGSGKLIDCWDESLERLTPAWGSFPDYRPPRLYRKRIDWILATPTVSVLRMGINVARFDGKWASDHAPVQAVLRFAESEERPGGR